MTPLSEYIAKLEERCRKRLERWKAKHNADWRLYAVLGGMGWYFYGMIVNSVRLGIRQSFDVESDIASIWVVNPFRNLIAPFTLTGLGLTAALLVLACLLTRRGFNWLSGYHPVHDKRGFDILPDGTHADWMTSPARYTASTAIIRWTTTAFRCTSRRAAKAVLPEICW